MESLVSPYSPSYPPASGPVVTPNLDGIAKERPSSEAANRQRHPGDRVTINGASGTEAEFRPYGPDGRSHPISETGHRAGDGASAEGERNVSAFGAESGEKSTTAGGKATTLEKTGTGEKQDPAVQQEVARLKAAEEKVKAHEAAHKSAGGTIAGPISYTYTRGPDGHSYITGGEVPISVSPGRTPQETAGRMEQVIRAALAPADPSPQDRSVAAQASVQLQEARRQAVDPPASAAADEVAGPGADAAAEPAAPGEEKGDRATTPSLGKGFQPDLPATAGASSPREDRAEVPDTSGDSSGTRPASSSGQVSVSHAAESRSTLLRQVYGDPLVAAESPVRLIALAA